MSTTTTKEPTVSDLQNRLTVAQARQAAMGPEHDALRQQRREAFMAGGDTATLDVKLATLDRDAEDLTALIASTTSALATATADQKQADIAAARLARARAELEYQEICSAAAARIVAVTTEELGKVGTARAVFEDSHYRLGKLEGHSVQLFYNVTFGRLAAFVDGFVRASSTKDLEIELEAARRKLAALEGA